MTPNSLAVPRTARTMASEPATAGGRRSIPLAPLLALVLAAVTPLPAQATNVPGGTISTATTWDLAGSPYVVQGVLTIASGGSITVNAGVQVRFSAGTWIDVNDGGTLTANGASGQNITFTSDAASPAGGDWYYIDAQAGSHLRLSYCDIGYGGRNSNPSLFLRTADAQVRNCTLHHFLGTGIQIEGTGNTAVVADTTITTTTGWALFQNTINMAPQYSHVTLTGGGVNAVIVEGATVSGAVTLDGGAARLNGAPIILLRTLSIPAAATLTVAPGTDLRVPAGGWFDVLQGGALIAEGTASAPITFRANAASAAAGDWYYINATAGSTLRLRYCDLGYGGRNANPALILRSSDVQVRNCTLHDFLGTGINIEGGGITPLIADTTITTTAGLAIYQNTMNMAPQYSNVTLAGGGTRAVIVDGAVISGSVTLDGTAARFAGSAPIILVNSTYVPAAATLTVVAGTELRTPPGGSFEVQEGGALVAEGTASAPITFRANTAPAAAGDWYWIVAQPGSTLRLKYCDIGYGGRNASPALILRGSDAQVRNCALHDFPGTGINIEGGGISPLVADTTITTTAGLAIYQSTMNMAPQYANVTLAGGGTRALTVDDSVVSGSVTLDGTAARFTGGAPIILVKSTYVPAAATLTVVAGTELRTPPGGLFEVQEGGALVAEGTASAPIVIRASTAAASAGDWYWIVAQPGSTLRLKYCDIGYGGRNASPALILRSSDAQVRTCTLHDFPGTGINLEGGGITPLVADTTITTTTGWAIYQSTMNMAPKYSHVTLGGAGVKALVVDGDTVSGAVTLSGNAAKFTGRKPILLLRSTIVPAGASLTVEAGTELRTPPSGSFEVQDGGTMVAEGSTSAPITFRANTETAAPGDWYYIDAQAGSHLRLKYCDIGYAGRNGNPTLLLRTSDAQVRDCVVHHGGGGGLQLEGEGLAPTISGTRIESNAGWALYHNTPNMAPSYGGVSISGNGRDALLIEGSVVTRAVVLDAAGFGGQPIVLNRAITIASGAALTVAPSAEIRFPAGWWLDVQAGGTLVAEGTAAQRVAFVPDVATPKAGDWYYLHALAGSHLRLANVGLRYGGRNGSTTVWVETTDAAIANCTVTGNGGDGLMAANEASPRLSHNQISANIFGVRNTSARSFVDARLTWWGDASGPYHPTQNPNGKGNAVSDRVLFVPWLQDESGTVLSKVFLQVAGPSRAAPGDTTDYAVSYYAGEAVHNAVLIMLLPGGSRFVSATGGGAEWPELRQVVWKLGDLAAGDEGVLGVQVTFGFGLPRNMRARALALLGGSDHPVEGVDIQRYLDWQPLQLTAARMLSGAEVTALRAANPDFDMLLTRAATDGFTLLGTRSVTVSGGRSANVALLGRRGAYRAVALESGLAVSLSLQSGAIEIADVSGSMRYDTATNQSTYGGSWVHGAGALSGTSQAKARVGPCLRNRLIWTALEYTSVESARTIMPILETPLCWQCFASQSGDPDLCDPCLTKLIAADPKVFTALETAASYRGCQDPKDTYWDCRTSKGVGEDITLCEVVTGWLAWAGLDDPQAMTRTYRCGADGTYGTPSEPRPCPQGQTCIPEEDFWGDESMTSHCGCAPQTASGQSSPAGLPSLDSLAASDVTCARLTASGATCALAETRVRPAGDPNEKLGPVGDVVSGQLVDYTVNCENVGEGRAYGVYIVDTVSPHIDETTMTLRGNAVYLAATREILWDIGELAAKSENGAKASVGFSARLRNGLPAETVVTNQAVVYFPSVPEETPTNTIVNVVRPVAAIPQRLSTPAGQPLAITLAGRDATGLPLTFAVVAPPTGGKLAGTPPQLTYTADASFSGADTLTFLASNGTDQSRPAEVAITVTPSPADSTPPQVVWTSPTAGGTPIEPPQKPLLTGPSGLMYGPPIVVQLSEALDPATVDGATVSMTDASGRSVAALVAYDESLHQVAITLQERWQVTTYTVKLSTGLTDASGNRLAAPYTWSFEAKPISLIRERLWSQQ